MIYLVHGENILKIAEAVSDLTATSNVQKFDGKNVDWFSVKERFGAQSLFGEAQTMVIRDFFTAKTKAQVLNELIEFLNSQHTANTVIFEEFTTVENANKLFQWIQGNGTVLYFAKQNRVQLKKWITETIHKKGMDIDDDAAEFLSDRYTQDGWALTHELEKLHAYCMKTKRITLQDVNVLCVPQEEQNIFQLSDTLAAKNIRQALRIFNQLLHEGSALPYITVMLARQVRLLLLTRLLLDEKLGKSEIQKKIGAHPFVVEKLLKQAGNFIGLELQSAYTALILNDGNVKQGKSQPQLSLELWMDNFCHGNYR